MRDEPAFYSAGKVAALLGVHINTVRRWCDDGTLACVQPRGGKHRRIPAAAVKALRDSMLAKLAA